jgi:hypothetical protein
VPAGSIAESTSSDLDFNSLCRLRLDRKREIVGAEKKKKRTKKNRRIPADDRDGRDGRDEQGPRPDITKPVDALKKARQTGRTCSTPERTSQSKR